MRERVEIRRIEGIIPVEAVSRNLPVKWENFSYRQMRQLLSLVSKGEQKGKGEFEDIIRATFLGYTPEGKAKLRSGKLTLIADVKLPVELQEGQELLLRLKEVSPKLVFSLVSAGVSPKELSKFVASVLGKLLKGEPLPLNAVFTPAVVTYLEELFKKELPQLAPAFGEFKEALLKGDPAAAVSRYALVGLLLLIDNFEQFKPRLPRWVTKEKLTELLNTLLGVYALYLVTGTVIVPLLTVSDFKGRLFVKREGELFKALLELETPKGELKALLKLLGYELSVDLWAEEPLKELLRPEELAAELESVGFKVVYCKFSPGELHPREEGFLKGSSFEFLA